MVYMAVTGVVQVQAPQRHRAVREGLRLHRAVLLKIAERSA